MIDLSHTRADLLAKLEAPDLAAAPLVNITDPRVVSGDARVRISGHTRHSLFPLLEATLSERYGALPRPQVIRDLLLPLRNALGNAFDHGNHRDCSKAIGVELMLTRKGALIAVTDEGNGFDVGLTFRRFREQECYFEGQGAGFRNLHRATSPVTYEDGGRTVLLCFQPSWQEAEAVLVADPNLSADPTIVPGAVSVLNKVTDSQWIQSCFSAELPEFANDRKRIESCHAYTVQVSAGGDCAIRYVLQVRGDDDHSTETQIFTGRLHTEEATASVAFASATRLYDANAAKGLRIPRPVAQLSAEPRLVLYDFHPWMDLWEYLAFHDAVASLRHSATRIGQWLGALHRSQMTFRVTEPNIMHDSVPLNLAGAEKNLGELPDGPVLVRRFRSAVQRIQKCAEPRRPRTLTPIHGSLGWDCIHYAVDKRFYLNRFETCRQGDPRVDLGGYAADLLGFTLARHEEAAYPDCCDEFLRRYHSTAGYPVDRRDLRAGILLAVSERLRRASSLTEAWANHSLGVLEALLSPAKGLPSYS